MPAGALNAGQFDPLLTYAGDYPLRPETWVRRPQGLPHHTLHVGFSGTATFRYGDRSVDVGEGDAVLIEPGTPHDYGNAGQQEWKLVYVVFVVRSEWLPLLDWPIEFPGHRLLHLLPSKARTTAYAKLRELAALVLMESQRREAFLANALEAALLWMNVAGATGDPAPPMDTRLQRTVQHIRQHLSDPLDSDQLCEISGLSVAQLARLFRQRFNQTPAHFVEFLRMERGCRLLDHTGMSIAEVAEKVGYRDPFYFTNRFRRAVGVSPRAYRGRNRTK